MKCPKCSSDLVQKMHRGIEVDYCDNSKGMWLDAEELDELEDQAYDEDEYKGSLFLSLPSLRKATAAISVQAAQPGTGAL